MGPTLSQVYDRYLADPTKRRSARTMLAHHTKRCVVEDVLGANTPIASITRDQCRDLLETLRWLRDPAKTAKAEHSIRTINSTNLNAYMARFVLHDQPRRVPANRQQIVGEIWLGRIGQSDEWIFCLTAARDAA
jgi:hypothetical protein